MPEYPVNAALTVRECLNTAFYKIDRLLEDGICEKCALKLVCRDYGIDYGRLLVLYLDRNVDGSED